MKIIVLLLLSCSLIVGSIGVVSWTTKDFSESDIYFPTPEEPANVHMEALATGSLTFNGKYILLKGGCPFDRTEMLLVWPYGYSVEVEKWKIHILDDNGNIVASVGDHAKIGGGENPISNVEKLIGESLPDDWNGTCWLVSKIVNN